MKSSSLALRILTTTALTVGLAVVGRAQNREKFGISAKAGGVNSVSGRVMVKRSGQTSEQLLTAKDDLVSGDVVGTSAGSRAEVLLNPGSYLRLAENTVFELADNSLDNLRVRLIKGSAILEAIGADDTQLRIAIVTEQGRFVIVRRGVYRINVQPGSTQLLVRKGRIWINDDPRQIVKGGNEVTFTSSSFLSAKLSKKSQDQFDSWSKDRGQTLARANEKLSARMLNGYLTNYRGWPSAGFGRWGLWTFSPSFGCYTFLPFQHGWASPYGGYYGWIYSFNYFPGYGCCGSGVIDRLIIVHHPPSSGGSSGGSSSGSSGASSGGSSGGSGSGSPPPTVISAPPSPPAPRDSGSPIHRGRERDPND